MGLVEKVIEHRDELGHKAKECMESRRAQLPHAGRNYCLLSKTNEYHYCPLQADAKEGECRLSACLRDEYLRELNQRNR